MKTAQFGLLQPRLTPLARPGKVVKNMGQEKKAPRIYLIASEEAQPDIQAPPGRKFDVVVVPIVDRDLNAVAEAAADPAARSARLCYGNGKCIALVETD